jgi:hypothetical protein
MGVNIHPYAEVKKEDKWIAVTARVFPLTHWEVQTKGHTHTSRPFKWRSYPLFGFLGNTCNYSASEYLSDKRGIPDDSPTKLQPGDPNYEGFYGHSWVSLRELIEFDYNKGFEDRRSGMETVEPGKGKKILYKDFLGTHFFEHLETLKTLGDVDNVRIVFWFD